MVSDSSKLDLTFYYLNKRLLGEKAPDYQHLLDIDTIRMCINKSQTKSTNSF